MPSDIQLPCVAKGCQFYKEISADRSWCALLNGSSTAQACTLFGLALSWGFCPNGCFGKMTRQEFIDRISEMR